MRGALLAAVVVLQGVASSWAVCNPNIGFVKDCLIPSKNTTYLCCDTCDQICWEQSEACSDIIKGREEQTVFMPAHTPVDRYKQWAAKALALTRFDTCWSKTPTVDFAKAQWKARFKDHIRRIVNEEDAKSSCASLMSIKKDKRMAVDLSSYIPIPAFERLYHCLCEGADTEWPNDLMIKKEAEHIKKTTVKGHYITMQASWTRTCKKKTTVVDEVSKDVVVA